MRRFYALSRAVGFAGLLLGMSSGAWAQTFPTPPSTTGSITVSSGTASAYGTGNAAISVSGLSGSLTTVSLTLTSVSGFPSAELDNMGFLLQSPGGINYEFLAATCDQATVNATLVFADANSGFAPFMCTGGGTLNVKPTDYDWPMFPNTYTGINYTVTAAHAAGCPASAGGCGSGTFTNLFAGLTGNSGSNALNGTWKLYIADVGGTHDENGTIASWSLTFTTTGAGMMTSTSLAAGSPNPSFTSGGGSTVTFTATVTANSNPVTSGTVTLHDVTTNTDLVSGVALNGSGQATLQAAMPVQGPNTVEAVYSGASGFQASTSGTQSQTAWNHATNPSGTTYCNDNSSAPLSTISIPFGNANGIASSPYPDEMILGNGEVGAGGLIQHMTIELDTINYNDNLSNLEMMLVSPGGTAYEFMSQTGGGGNLGSPITLTFDDNASSSLSPGTVPTTGTYKPTSDVCSPSCNNPQDPYPSPAPGSFSSAEPHGTTTMTEAFGGQAIAGAWQLFIATRGNANNHTGTIKGWCMAFTLQANAHGTQTVVTSSKNPAIQGVDNVTITATVTTTDNSGTVTGGTVSFTDGTDTLATAGVVNGTASFSTSSLSEGTHQILASYSGTNTGTIFGVSSGTIDQRINDATVNTGLQFCNNGAIALPAPNQSLGPAAPYPSNIMVANMPGTVDSFTVTLNSFQATAVDWVQSLLVGPNGGDIDFFSRTGGINPFGPGNLTFSDAAGSTVPNGNFAAGTYKPTSETKPNTYQPCPSNAPGCQSPAVGPPAPQETYNYAAPAGSATFASVFSTGMANTTFTGNGTWSLYQALNMEGALDGSESGWCMTFTVNPPALTGTKGPSGAMVTQGQSSSITVVVHNPSGPGSAGGVEPVSVADTFPAGLTPTGGSGTKWTCPAPSGQTITCTSSEFIAPGNDFDTLTINYSAANDATVGTANNTAVISGSGLTANVNTNTLGIMVKPAPVLAVSKTAMGTFTQGGTGEWDISVTNTAPNSTTQGTTTVVDTLPSGYTVANFGTTSMSWNCSGTGTQTATCTTTAAVSGGSSFPSLQIISNIPTTSPTSVTNNVVAYGGGDLTHTNSTNGATGFATISVVQVPASITINANGMTSESLSTTVGTAFGSLAVTVKDAANVIINNAGVTFTATTGGAGQSGKFSNNTNTITVNTNASGVADPGIFTANTKVGSYMVSVSPASGTGSATFNLTNTAGTATQLVAGTGTSPQTVTVGMALGTPLSVTAEDQYGNPVSGVSVTFTAPATGASGAFSNSTNTISGGTNANGQISESFTANTIGGGPYSVTASASGTNTVSFMITNAPGTPATVTATSGGGQTTNVNTQFTNPLVATVTDQYGNVVPGVDVTFTPVPNMNGASCTLASAGGMARTPAAAQFNRRPTTSKPRIMAGVDVTTGPNGIAEATCTANGTAGAYSVSASAGNATSASFGLTNDAGTVQVTVTTNIMGPTIIVDNGTPFTGSQMFQWAPNSSHTLATTTTQTNGTTQYVWLNWSDMGAASHMVSGPSTTTTFTATFKTQYQLTTSVNLPAGGTISPATGFYDSGSNINITATPNSGYVFSNFTGDLGSSTSPLPVTLRGPLSETANFTGGPTSMGMNIGAKSGSRNARVWPVVITNNGPGVALGAEVANLVLTQTAGAACTPMISGVPAVAGDLAAHASGTANITIDFSSCSGTPVFKATFTLSSNNGAFTSTVVKSSQLP